MSTTRYQPLLGLALAWLPVLQPARAEDREITAMLNQIYHAEASQEREKLIGGMLSQGESSKLALRQVARETDDGRTFWGLTLVAQESGDAEIARILTERLLDPKDRFLPGYLGAGIVMLQGPPCYEELKNLALSSPPEVRTRLIKGIGYSGYATSEDPVPTLMALAEALSGKEQKLAYEQAIFVLEQRGRHVSEEGQRLQLARHLLSWIYSDRQAEADPSGRNDMPQCPYPPQTRDRNPPFGVAFDRPSGGRDCYTSSNGAVRKADSKSVKTELHVKLKHRGDFAAAFFMFEQPGSRYATVGVLFRKPNGAWEYGGYTRIRSGPLFYH